MTNNRAVQAAINIAGTARELAVTANVTERTISLALNGRIELTAATARRLSKAVNDKIPPHYFVFPDLMPTESL